ncbi:acyl carrier protein [Cryobacterium sp. TMS1-13-1]|uniref:acyl carrier protein n=1 Tax=Cryobacterium sp. TMS1-13-1 TaxID=1259220 RepID=UPI00141AF591|nr:phosphopantetheine-binding protein [Cryobacterium sp. TMS1-13-1]
MSNASLEYRIVAAIIERLGLEVEASDVNADAPIFASLSEGTEHEESSLNLDSIDILEVVLALNSEFDVDIPDDRPEVFTSVRTIAEFVREQETDAA